MSDGSSDVCSSDLFRVRLTFIQAPTKRIDSIGYTLPEMLLDIFDRYAAVFVGVVQYRCDALLFCLASEHDAKRMEDIGRAAFVDLPGVRARGKNDRLIEE